MKFLFSSKILKDNLFRIYVLFFGFFALVCLIIFDVYRENIFFKNCHERLASVELKAKTLKVYDQKKKAFIASFKAADPLFIQHYLETLQFLKPDIEKLKILHQHPSFVNCDELLKRIGFLTGNENRMRFKQISKKIGPFYEEIIEKQMHSIELSFEDVKEFFLQVEGEGFFKRPQLQIKEFFLKKQKMDGSRETFILNTELIERIPLSSI